MRIRTALAATALAAAAVMGASGTALAHDDNDHGWEAGYAYQNLGGPTGITRFAAYGEGDGGEHGGRHFWEAGYENLGGPAGITGGYGRGAGDDGDHYDHGDHDDHEGHGEHGE
ncbi:hypothetical protein ACIRF8_02495 [Streptomyces sp. NPDC102406]|uniref:hypothetical protein n=1 Tax=Streptomyces sp. NPDC102406 TaxID=3366171 RepID=UPI00382764B2